MTSPTIFNKLLIWPITNILIVFYKFFIFLRIPGALGWAVIAITALIRLILYPLTMSQLKNAQKLNKLKPAIDKITKKHKHDKMKLQKEQMRLYKEAGINPTLGCLPMLLQMPIIIALYNVFLRLLSNGNISEIVEDINNVLYIPALKIESLDMSFFGINLGHKPSDWGNYGLWLLLIPVITGGLQYIQARMMSSQHQDSQKKEEKKKEDEESFSVVMQKQMSVMMPLMIGFFSYSFPIGLSLYWNTFTVFGIIQQYHIGKIGDKHGKK